MPESVLFGIALVIVLGVSAQWTAWRLGLPSILMLLVFGLLAGPLTGVLDPDRLFGSFLFPVASLFVGLILYEGGLSLRLSELRGVGAVVRNLVTIGVLVTWALAALAAKYLLYLDTGLALLLGAVLTVTGPTVIGPLLRHIRPSGPVGPILKWEGIVIDPIGALLAVLVFEALVGGGHIDPGSHIVLAIVRTVLIGGGLGVAAGWLLAFLLARYWVPDVLQNAVSIMLVIAIYTAANMAQDEAGLLAVTIMGIVLANQKWADVGEIVEFKENLRVLLISFLFIVLAARLNLRDLLVVGLPELAFVAVLVLVVRPASVLVSTVTGGLSRRDRMFLAWMAPRGIVAAAVASLFAIRLESLGYASASLLASATFVAIIGTVAVYGLSSPWLARRLGVAEPNPQGLLIVGAHTWARSLAELLQRRGITVRMVDTNWDNVVAARLAGLDAIHGSALAEHTLEQLDLGGLGRLLALTSNDWVNALVVQHFAPVFGRSACYQLAPAGPDEKTDEAHRHLFGRWLFDRSLTMWAIGSRLHEGFSFKATGLTPAFDYARFRARYGEQAAVLFVQRGSQLEIITADKTVEPEPGDTIIALVPEVETPPPDRADQGSDDAGVSSADVGT